MTKLLVVDDSALMRRVLAETFRHAGFEVAVARSGAEALELLHGFRPNVVTLDIHMPGMDGLACLDRIMLERPTPVVMVSALTGEGAAETLEALALGAVDFAEKPAGAVSLSIDAFAPELVRKVREAAQVRISRTRRLAERVRHRITQAVPAPVTPPLRLAPPGPAGEGVVLVGCSTGGPPALEALLAPLDAAFPWPIVIAQHMPAAFTGPLAQRLDRLCAIAVHEVARPTPLEPGHAYIGRGDADLLVVARAGGLVAMAAPSSPEHHWHPSVDRLVASAMEAVPARDLVGVLMTGMGTDGAQAMTVLHAHGGRTIAEAEETAIVWGMPGTLARAGGASCVAPLGRIAAELCAMIAR